MRTDELIKALAADTPTRAPTLSRSIGLALAAGIVAAGVLFAIFLGPRGDIAHASQTWRFQLKLGITILLLISAIPALISLARPTPITWRSLLPLVVAPALLVAALVLELLITPAESWAARMVGRNWHHCLTIIPTLALAPLIVVFIALRKGAPASPSLTGAVAGLLAGAVSATYYATLCTDDSPLFVATWYTIAIAGLAIAATFAGRALLKW